MLVFHKMNPAEEELATLIGSQSPVFCLTVNSFLKFQLKRKPVGQDGTETFLKQARSLLQGIVGDKMDEVSAASIRYARYELDTDPVFQKNFDEEPRAIVLADLVAAFKKYTESQAPEET